MAAPLHILLVEDNDNDAALMVRQLMAAGLEFAIDRVMTQDEFLRALETGPDLVLSDVELPMFDGLRALELLRERNDDTPFVLVSGTIGEELAVRAMKFGATDYVLKDRLARLGPAVVQALDQAHVKRERRQAQGALADSEARYRLLVEQASDGIFIIGTDGRFDDVNTRAVEMLGFDRETLLATRAADLVREVERPRLAEEAQLLRQQLRRVSEWHVRCGNGSDLIAEVSARLMPDGRVLAILRDVTERKEAEAASRRQMELEARLARLAATAPGAIYSFRMPDGAPPRFPYASEQLAALVGLPADELARDASGALALVHAEDLPGLLRSIRDSAASMEMWTEAFRYHHPVKGEIWIEGRSTPMHDEDGLVWHGFMIDVTGRKELEEQFRQAQKMEAVGQLASGVAHDFNNLLTIIQGNATMLAEVPPDKQAECTHDILEAAARAGALTRQLLLFSRKQVMRSVDLDLNAVVGNMAKLLQRLLGEDIALTADFSPRAPMIRGDVGMIEQVLLNLAVNSRDAMPAGGRLTIQTSLETPASDRPTGPSAHLRIADTGDGIAPDVLPRIFEPFFTTKQVGKGTGLGLATVYGIVQQHNGSIEVRSTLGSGTTFDIRFPALAASAAAADDAAGPRVAPRGHETILVVEDEAPVRLLVGHVLERSGYEVIMAATGVEALALWRQRAGDIDLLLTDMVMPDGVTGRELASQLLADRADLKVIYTSGYSAEFTGKGLPLIEGVNFIQKPYLPHELATTVRACLDRRP